MSDYSNDPSAIPASWWSQIRFRLGDRTARTIFAQLGPEPDRRSAANGGDILIGVVDEGWGPAFVNALNADPRRTLSLLPTEVRLRLGAAVAWRRTSDNDPTAEREVHDPPPPANDYLAAAGGRITPDAWQPAASAPSATDDTGRRRTIVFEQIIESNGEVREPPPEGFEPFAVIRDDDHRRRVYWRGPAA